MLNISPQMKAVFREQAARANGHDKAPRGARWTVPAMTWRDPATIPRRVFLYGHYYARGFVSATVADGGIGKSILKIAEILAMATGRDLLGIAPQERVRALYWNGDDPYEEVERRIFAVCEHHGIDAKRLMDERWLYVGTRDKHPLNLADMERGRVVINHNLIEEMCAFIKNNEIGFAAFDPFKACHRASENDNTDIDAVAQAFSTIAERTNAAIGLDHHIRKPAYGQGEATTADARGASALINKVRLSRVCNLMTPAQAVEARIKEDDRRRYFRVDYGKGNIVGMRTAKSPDRSRRVC
jgi:RecA-family ATPase